MAVTANKSPGIFPLLLAIACLATAVMLSQGGDRSGDASPSEPSGDSQEELASLPPNIPGVEEWHAATTSRKCNEMAETFRLQGRNVKLVRIRHLPSGRNSILSVLCQFQGKDAGIGSPFEDRRYNSLDEYRL